MQWYGVEWYWWIVVGATWPFAGALAFRFGKLVEQVTGQRTPDTKGLLWMNIALGWIICAVVFFFLVVVSTNRFILRPANRLLKRIAGFKP